MRLPVRVAAADGFCRYLFSSALTNRRLLKPSLGMCLVALALARQAVEMDFVWWFLMKPRCILGLEVLLATGWDFL